MLIAYVVISICRYKYMLITVIIGIGYTIYWIAAGGIGSFVVAGSLEKVHVRPKKVQVRPPSK